jgi:hypothetical protein
MRSLADVDCIVHRDPPLADIRGDVAFRMHSKFRRHHKGLASVPSQAPWYSLPGSPPVRPVQSADLSALPSVRSTSRRSWWHGWIDQHHIRTAAVDLLREPR